ncbi:alpha/beta fold hydrolase [Curtobacterium sp. MCPF17_052]|uniref:alpha/beta fold hydrolase n=1 Tax=Curtobacterium sp. MCPF17_052 TaxID=2175655 RepID=UPI0024DF67BC|nr:alpha/beta fold hydrolase [Curtobacterium sp. MCPF17_052]WIB12657.1 alpha/beta fold hydrolase [Curtobacterium sp. MCPF17_052]
MQTIELGDGRSVLVDDTAADHGADGGWPTLVWHHESPHTGVLFEPLRSAATDRGLRLVAVTRPGYGGADPLPGRRVADGAHDLEQVLDALGIDRVAALGGSGGGPHALAAAALLPDRVAAVATLASPAPFDDSPTWWDGMADDAGLRAATAGRQARITWAASAAFDPSQFVDTDWAALDGDWAALGQDATAAGGSGLQGGADDDVAFVTDWGVRPVGGHGADVPGARQAGPGRPGGARPSAGRGDARGGVRGASGRRPHRGPVDGADADGPPRRGPARLRCPTAPRPVLQQQDVSRGVRGVPRRAGRSGTGLRRCSGAALRARGRCC